MEADFSSDDSEHVSFDPEEEENKDDQDSFRFDTEYEVKDERKRGGIEKAQKLL